eukprot:1157728-Pelagomonas_calceolata.AAC.12
MTGMHTETQQHSTQLAIMDHRSSSIDVAARPHSPHFCKTAPGSSSCRWRSIAGEPPCSAPASACLPAVAVAAPCNFAYCSRPQEHGCAHGTSGTHVHGLALCRANCVPVSGNQAAQRSLRSVKHKDNTRPR